jgi:hypothetical protein
MAVLLRQIQQAAGHVGQNFREAKLLFIVSYVLLGTYWGTFRCAAASMPWRSTSSALITTSLLSSQQPHCPSPYLNRGTGGSKVGLRFPSKLGICRSQHGRA